MVYGLCPNHFFEYVRLVCRDCVDFRSDVQLLYDMEPIAQLLIFSIKLCFIYVVWLV